MRGQALIAVAILAVWGLFLHNAAPSVTAGDSGEFVTAASTLSLPHPPSYPLYSLAGKAFTSLLPWGNRAYRLNVFSAAAHLLSLLLIFLMARRMGLSGGAGFFAFLLAAGTPAFFHNSLITEVFALNTLMALAVWAAVLGGVRRMPLAGFLAGLGLGNHHTLLFLAPGGVAALSLRKYVKRPLLLAAVFLLVGLSVYFALAFRSRKEPPLDWGNPETLSGLYRTVTRQDYGSLTLSLGETPSLSFSNTARQAGRFLRFYARELSAAGTVLVLIGTVLLWRENRALTLGLALAWFFTGPFFFVLGNLGFDAQSDGVLERFLILPVVFSVFAAARTWDLARARAGWAAALLFLLPVFLLRTSGRAYPLRTDFLVNDYSQGILRTLPPGASFFMDGGDDTFFSMAFQRFVQRRREDLSLFDRGGLIFRSPYGPDFRSLSRDAKEERRREVERSWLAHGPVFYSTMNEKILPGSSLRLRGFLYEAASPERPIDRPEAWPFYALRSLYPPASGEYRTLALAPYFPFMRARSHWEAGRYDEAIGSLRRARRMAPEVPWVKSNLVAQYLDDAFDRMSAGDLERAERLYLLALDLEPDRPDAMTNLGVLWEKRDDWARSAEWYERALRSDPRNVNALYNLSVVHWRRGDWDSVVALLERVLALEPSHPGALRYLPAARERRGR